MGDCSRRTRSGEQNKKHHTKNIQQNQWETDNTRRGRLNKKQATCDKYDIQKVHRKNKSPKYTILDAETFADIKQLLERRKLNDVEGIQDEDKLAEILEDLRVKDKNWYTKHIYIAMAIPASGDKERENFDTSTHSEIGYINIEMARYGA